MSESDSFSPPADSNPPPESASTGPASLGNRLMNMFIAPTEVFDEAKASPPNALNWVVPMILAIVLGIGYSLVVFSQPVILQGLREAQEKSIQQRLEAGKMTQQQADQAQAVSEKFMTPTILKMFGIGGVFVFQIVMLFVFSLAIWLVGKYAFKSPFSYARAMDVVGLATMPAIPGVIIATLLAVIYGNLYMTPGPVLLVDHFDGLNKLHRTLSALNVFYLWTIALMALGLARLSGASFWKACAWGFGLWAFISLGPIWFFGSNIHGK
jgi:hypothetical protein